MKFLRLLNQVSVIPVFIAFFYAMWVYRKLPKELKAFSLFVFLSGIIQAASSFLWYKKINNLPLLHLYVAVGFISLALFYERVLDGFINKKIIRSAAGSFLIFTVANSLIIQPLTSFNSYALTVESILVVILALTTYMVMMEDIVKEKRQEIAKSLGWINSGLFIYYSSSLVIFHLQFFFDQDRIFKFFSREFNLQAWMLHAFFSLIMYLCFVVGLWKSPKSRL